MKNFLGKLITAVGVAAFALGLAGGAANAAGASLAKTHLVIQVSSADPTIQMIALNNAVNVQKAIPGAVVEIVAYGPGLGLLTLKSKQKDRVASLALNEGLTFSACGNTMNKVAKKKRQYAQADQRRQSRHCGCDPDHGTSVHGLRLRQAVIPRNCIIGKRDAAASLFLWPSPVRPGPARPRECSS